MLDTKTIEIVKSTAPVLKHVDELSGSKNRVKSYVCYDSPTDEDRLAQGFDKDGRIDLNVLSSIKPTEQAEYYFCGSVPFMESIAKMLRQLYIPKEDFHYESFSPLALLDEE
ncbi:hypothetical protein [Cohnella yongneupensis]|uniref:Oxidoreductase FAD/NAD(P)-binding domain-containing protein n=1 Tax=Cohnella yongneupensis TaxID=425006 RepID=A0ABW0QTT4_9BACL